MLNNISIFPEIIRLAKFWIVGGIGALINFAFLWMFTEIFGFHYMLSAIIAGFINVTYNFFANNFWSFADRNDINLTSGYAKFMIAMFSYLIVYYAIFYVLTEFVIKDYSFYFVKGYMISAIMSTAIATLPKYFLCLLWVWKK